MRRPPIHASCNSASGTRVVLPAPGGACSTAWRPCASASRRGGRQTSTGKGGAFERAEDMMRIVSWRLLRGALYKLFCSAGRARASRLPETKHHTPHNNHKQTQTHQKTTKKKRTTNTISNR